MPRNMGFSLTTQQMYDRTKTVTRRNAWWNLNKGDIVMACEKAMGFKKGEKVKRIGLIRIVHLSTVPIYSITKQDCIKEGFPQMTPADFISMFCKHYAVNMSTTVNRIEFEFID